MKRFAVILLGSLLFLVAVACGGGDDDDASPTPGSDDGTPAASATTEATSESGGDNGGSSGAGAGSDFCGVDSEDAINSFDATLDPDTLRDQLEAARDALNDWADSAPGEVRDDAQLVASTMNGFFELLDEYDYNFLAMGTGAINDPRFAALDTQEFQDATDHLSSYCGWDSIGPSLDDSGSTGGGTGTGGGGFTVDLPDDFPEDFVPPDSSADFAGSFGGGTTAVFTSTATVDEVKEFYQSSLGDPLASTAEGILWVGTTDGGTDFTVTISGSDGAVSVSVAVGGG